MLIFTRLSRQTQGYHLLAQKGGGVNTRKSDEDPFFMMHQWVEGEQRRVAKRPLDGKQRSVEEQIKQRSKDIRRTERHGEKEGEETREEL